MLWEANWGSYLANKPTTIQGFVSDLTSDPTHMYNSFPNWPISIEGGKWKTGPLKGQSTKGTYKSALDALKECGITLQ
jgi:hypothetical protein